MGLKTYKKNYLCNVDDRCLHLIRNFPLQLLPNIVQVIER